MTNMIYENVSIGGSTLIEPPCIIGKPPRGAEPGERELRLGTGCHIRPFSTVYAGSLIGDHVQTGQGVSIREDNSIGNNVSIGTHAVLEAGNTIGEHSRIHTGCFLELTTIGRHVFVGPHVVFTDDPHPMGCPRYRECKGGPVVGDYARIGANCTILPGVRIGSNALIGAGSVVVHDIPDNAVAVGNPARVIKYVHELTCAAGFYEKPYQWPPYDAL